MAAVDSNSVRELIRARLRQPGDATSLEGDHRVAGIPASTEELTPAAVLVGLVERQQGLTVLLTQRTQHLTHHPGQVSFPGGRCEQHDRDACATALRETEEEIGLQRQHIDIIGQLDHYQTGTGFRVTPVVSLITPPFELRPDPGEVAAVFEVPLAFILDPNNHQRDSRLVRGQPRQFYVLAYQDYHIWGATAAMLVGFAARLESVREALTAAQDSL